MSSTAIELQMEKNSELQMESNLEHQMENNSEQHVDNDHLLSENKILRKKLNELATCYLRCEKEVGTLLNEKRAVYKKYEKVSSKNKLMKKLLKKAVKAYRKLSKSQNVDEIASADSLSFQTEFGDDLHHRDTYVNTTEEKFTEQLKNESKMTNKRKRNKNKNDIEDGETAAKQCKIHDTCFFEENVGLLSMKCSESKEHVIEVETSLTKTSCTYLICQQKEKSRVTGLNEDCSSNGSVCQDMVSSEELAEPFEELKTAKCKYYSSLEYLEYDSDSLVIDYSSSEE